MSKAILTNSKIGISMSDLEARARSGCPIAQQEMTNRCMNFSTVVLGDAVVEGMTRKDQVKEMRYD